MVALDLFMELHRRLFCRLLASSGRELRGYNGPPVVKSLERPWNRGNVALCSCCGDLKHAQESAAY